MPRCLLVDDNVIAPRQNFSIGVSDVELGKRRPAGDAGPDARHLVRIVDGCLLALCLLQRQHRSWSRTRPEHSLAAFSPWPNLTEAYWMEKLENLTPGPRVSRQNSKDMFAAFRSHAA